MRYVKLIVLTTVILGTMAGAASSAEGPDSPKQKFEALMSVVGQSDDYAANITKIRKALPGFKGTSYDMSIRLLLAEQKHKLQKAAAPAEGTPAAGVGADVSGRSQADARARARAEEKARTKALAEAEKKARAERKAGAARRAEAARKAEDDARAAARSRTDASRKAAAAKKAEDARKAAEARKAEADARAGAAARAKAERDAQQKLYDDLRSLMRSSDSHAANIKKLEDGIKALAGTSHVKSLEKLLAAEKKALARKNAADAKAAAAKAKAEADAAAARKAEAAAAAKAKTDADAKARAKAERAAQQKLYDDLRSLTRTSDDHTATITKLEDGIKTLAGTSHVKPLEKLLTAEKSALARQNAADAKAAAAKAKADAARAKADAAAAAKEKAEAEAAAKAKADAEAKAAADKLYSEMRALVKGSDDHAANIKKLEDNAPKLVGSRYEGKLAPMISAEKKALDRKNAADAAATKAKADADAKARAKAERAAQQKLYDDLRSLTRSSDDHAVTIKKLEDGIKTLAGTSHVKPLEKLLAAEKSALARKEAADAKAAAAKTKADAAAAAKAKAEAAAAAKAKTDADAKAAADKLYGEMRALVRDSIDHAANIKTLEESAPKLVGSRYEGKLAPMIAAEKKALARKNASDARDQVEAKRRAAELLYTTVTAEVKKSSDHPANVTLIEDAAPKLAGTTYEGRLDPLLAAEKKTIADDAAAKAEAKARRLYEGARSALKRGSNRAAKIRMLEMIAPKLADTRYEGKLDAPLAAERKALAAEEKAKIEADAKKAYDDARAAVRRSKDHAANLKALEEAAAKLLRTRYEGKLDSMIAAEKKALNR